MSHEIRTPINGVLGMTALLLETKLSRRQRDMLDSARVSAHGLLDIINDILDFSRIDAGQMHIETVEFDLLDVVEEVLDLVAVRAHDKGLELAHKISRAVPSRLCGDPGRLRQILVNLTGNAVKFTDKGEVVVGVYLEWLGGQDARLRFEVSDTGIGIAAADQARLFKPFEQVDDSVTRRYGGTGLGLSITRQLSELMNGSVRVHSSLGHGSTFYVTLQFGLTDRRSSSGRVQQAFPTKRVLIADDNDTTRDILVYQCESWQMPCRAVQSGPAAVTAALNAVAEGDAFDVIVLDSQMRGMNGLATATSLATQLADATPPIILMTSISARIDERELTHAGITVSLSKPVKPTRLNAIFTQIFSDDNSISHFHASKPRAERTARLRGRVLVAEDNLINQKVAVGHLEGLGITADAVSNGAEALAALADNAYDAVLMDCHMPVLDGYAATRAIRQLDGPAAFVPIIALTASVMAGERELCRAAGMNDYVSKPITRLSLETVLSRWLAGRVSTGDQAQIAARPARDDGRIAVARPADGDPHKLDELEQLAVLANKPAMVEDLVSTFRGEVPELLAKLRTSAAAGDMRALAIRAHSLKGSAGQLGLQRVAAADWWLDSELKSRSKRAAGQSEGLELPVRKSRIASQKVSN